MQDWLYQGEMVMSEEGRLCSSTLCKRGVGRVKGIKEISLFGVNTQLFTFAGGGRFNCSLTCQ